MKQITAIFTSVLIFVQSASYADSGEQQIQKNNVNSSNQGSSSFSYQQNHDLSMVPSQSDLAEANISDQEVEQKVNLFILSLEKKINFLKEKTNKSLAETILLNYYQIVEKDVVSITKNRAQDKPFEKKDINNLINHVLETFKEFHEGSGDENEVSNIVNKNNDRNRYLDKYNNYWKNYWRDLNSEFPIFGIFLTTFFMSIIMDLMTVNVWNKCPEDVEAHLNLLPGVFVLNSIFIISLGKVIYTKAAVLLDLMRSRPRDVNKPIEDFESLMVLNKLAMKIEYGQTLTAEDALLDFMKENQLPQNKKLDFDDAALKIENEMLVQVQSLRKQISNDTLHIKDQLDKELAIEKLQIQSSFIKIIKNLSAFKSNLNFSAFRVIAEGVLSPENGLNKIYDWQDTVVYKLVVRGEFTKASQLINTYKAIFDTVSPIEKENMNLYISYIQQNIKNAMKISIINDNLIDQAGRFSLDEFLKSSWINLKNVPASLIEHPHTAKFFSTDRTTAIFSTKRAFSRQVLNCSEILKK